MAKTPLDRLCYGPEPIATSRTEANVPDVSDEELNAYILTRLKLLGVDLSVLPEDDGDSPADQKRILQSARRFLRTTPGVIAAFYMDPQEVPPDIYPAELAGGTVGVRDGL